MLAKQACFVIIENEFNTSGRWIVC